MRATRRAAAVVLCLCLAAPGVSAQRPPPDARLDPGLPDDLQGVGIEQHLDAPVPLELVFRDEHGRSVRFGDYLGDRPVVLAPAYYTCPMLCSVVLNGLASSLDVLAFDAGSEFDVVVVSFDPRDTSDEAMARKKSHLARYNREGAEDGWHFLTGEQDSIDALTEAIGFRYRWDPERQEFAHASGIMVLTPDGRLARYFFGVEYPPRDVRLALVEASENRIGTPVDRLLLYCYRYDPATGKYGAVVMNILRLCGVATLLGLGALILFLRPRHGRRKRAEEAV